MGSPFVIEHRIPWSDVDLAKLVYFPRYFSYFEMAELEWIRQHGLSYEKLLEELDVWMPRVAAHANYRSPARLADLIAIEMRLGRLGHSSFTLGFDALLLPGRKPVADGYIVIATVRRSSYRPTRVPEKLRALLAELEMRTVPS
ncbi:MAG TPA: thioesterase family protein [Vicinamibacteria bacterium]|nr:thioesterase family protein [Vicinamibacteria bacterium]